ncbi:MAG: type IX secretion system protein PorQ [Chitinophagaceae bacterium]|nr:MAG: type IX secretion system protein PorQ [Chitinophagaceae bacterium]
MRPRRSFPKQLLLLALSAASASFAGAQTVGGSAVYNFLHLPASPALSAAGGVNVSYAAPDAGLAANNPALLRPALHGQLGLNFNAFFAGTRAYQLAGAFHVAKWNTTFGSSLFYIDHGSLAQTDATGYETGSFRPRDMSFQLSAARSYGKRWHYGLTAKVIRSSYGSYGSTGLAFDLGLHYQDTARHFSAGLLAKNMGGQLSRFGSQGEDLPFDLQVGITQRLAKSPFGFSLTLQQLHRFHIGYNDTTFNNETGFTNKSSFATKLFNHVVLGTHVFLSRNLEATIGYNFLRRSDLNVGSTGNGLNGFSAGFTARFSRLQVQYARAYYQRGRAYNQFGIQLALQRKI